jgi:Tol biopolymer transport system component
LLFNELDTAEGKHCLFRLDVKTLGKEQLTFPSSGYQGDMNGRFSPDGKKIAFQRIYGYNKSDLFLLELETGDITQLTTDRKNISGLAWMPDGKELIFNSNSEGISRLWSYSFKRKKTEPFPTGGMDANRVSIARSGRRIAYSTHLHKSDIYEAALPDQRPAKIEPNELIASSRGDFFGKCSPDGKKIVFSSNRTGTEEIWVCDIDGSDPVQLTFLKVHSAVPYWSPDSRQIVFESNGDILLVDAEGRTHPRVLVDDPSDERIPGWSHDGKWVYFGSNRSGEYQAYRIYLESGKIEQLTHTSAFTGRESADGKYAYFECRDHDSIIYRVNLSTLMEEPAVIENVSNLIWTVGEEGVYYLKQMGEYTELKLYRHATGTTELVGTLDPGYSLTYVSETLGKILFYTSFGSADIYLVEDF